MPGAGRSQGQRCQGGGTRPGRPLPAVIAVLGRAGLGRPGHSHLYLRPQPCACPASGLQTASGLGAPSASSSVTNQPRPPRTGHQGPCSPQGEGVLALRRGQQKCLSLVGGQAGRALGQQQGEGGRVWSPPTSPLPPPPPGWASGQKDSVSCLHWRGWSSCPTQRPRRGSPASAPPRHLTHLDRASSPSFI